MIMRHHLLRHPRRRRPGRDRPIHQDVVAEVQTYVPGYRLLNEPQFDDPSVNSGGQALVTTFIEVEGAGDYLPPYAGNLDIMTAAATKVGEEIAKESLSATAGGGQA
jgi:acetaldehyde dehydrogenase